MYYKKNKFKIIYIFILLVQILFFNADYALAQYRWIGIGGGLRIPEPVSVANTLRQQWMELYHVNGGSIRNSAEQFNVSDQKNFPPEAMITFDPSEPREGQKITARATAMYFSNPKEKLYYTWYISHGDNFDNNEDLNGDGRRNHQDGKIEAMRIIAQGGFVDEENPLSTSRPDDDDGYRAYLGGDDKTTGNKYCYIHDFVSGTNFEIGLDNTEEITSYDLECPQGTSSYCVETNTSAEGTLTCNNNQITPTCNNSGEYECSQGVARCVDDNIISNANLYDSSTRAFKYIQPGTGLFLDAQCTDADVSPYIDDDNCFSSSVADDWEDAMNGLGLGGTECTNAQSYAISEPTCQTDNNTGGTRTCDHLFADFPGHTTGDRSFRQDEEGHWGTNPYDANTSGNGNLDEANAAGLGQESFSWTYQKGDKVGVLIEGTSMIPTKYADNSYMTMWALPKNIFYIERGPNKIELIKGYNVVIPTATNTIDERRTLNANLVDPSEKILKKLDVSLSYSPDSPVNDPTDSKMGDVLSVQSIIGNSSIDKSKLNYQWMVYIDRDENLATNDWTRIRDNVLIENEIIDGNLEGINIPSIDLSLNFNESVSSYFDDDVEYLRIWLKVTDDSETVGRGEVVVKVNSTDKRINAYLTSSSNGSSLSRGDAICNGILGAADRLSYYVCPVITNQILRLEASNTSGMTDFAWTVNENALTCDTTVFNNCCPDGSCVFLPISGSPGENFNVKLLAKDSGDGRNIELSKGFQIVKPYAKIVSVDQNSFFPKFLGNYNNLSGTQYADFSDSIFQTYPGASVTLRSEFHPIWLEDTGTVTFSWLLDGENVTNETNLREIGFNIDKNSGEAYNVEFNSFYKSSNEIRTILKNVWEINQVSSGGENLNSSIQGEILSGDVGGTIASKGAGKFLASIVSNLPSQTIFLLRVVLVIFVVILVSGMSLNLSPNFNKNKKKYYYE